MADEKNKNGANYPDDDPDEVTITLNETYGDDDTPPTRERVPFDLDVPLDLSDAVAAANRSRYVLDAVEENDAVSGLPAIDLDAHSHSVPSIVIEDSTPVAAASPQTKSEARKAQMPPDIPTIEDKETKLLREIDSLKNELKETNQNYLRAVADLQNFRRRGDEERRRIERDGNERLIKELLPVLDDFERAMEASSATNSYEQLISGLDAILRKFQDTMLKEGVTAIPSVGEKFDPDYHEAVMLDEGAEEQDEVITAELRRGYLLNDRVIRPSLVKVAKS